ncbi:MAG TPA: chitobiase/beta-hexosaminidase C-terminal domain-containing protein [Spirochaetota bacterium]|nr:chitobiase/beta-hexosaminidase C-terminal domain-containing protein [Spirochaetota bacterium]HOS33423.1 chitobiase/beta-hexosaminidase C-terminal domain-containing protein [Spirochaetota bacterium]HOS55919.1 chitobiase/beta-hexosaminidase C-terminal domain-containing protein [Spirochaetota bacterium]HPK61114.1 chitobiase/beta-hexosaminidase C-terminal domain-containing protein [Spirochaetota bacterium]HQF78414.1 chitobiase/beta-hexosaminidase C-terminal domain-containing protein [Spirochaeto
MKKLILSGLLIIAIASIFGSCNLNPFWGGGLEVDVEAPVLVVDYPKTFDFVTNGFTIRGTCTDNKEIAKILIRETRTSSEWLADINGVNWSKIITMESDGEYVFDIYAYDAAGNSSENSYKRITLTVHTVPPIAEVIYPPLLDVNVLKTYDFRNFDYIDCFKNQTFQIKGKTDSEYKVQSVSLELLDPSDDSVVYASTISHDETLDQIVNINFGESTSAKQGSVWNWAFNINCDSDIIVAGNPLEKNKAYYFNVRIKSKSMSDVEKIEKKKAVCVFNESDAPWQTITSIIDNDSVTPEAIISGNAYDDDGIKKIYIKIVEENVPVNIEGHSTWINETTDDAKTIIIDKSAETPKPRMFTWSVNAPKAVGNYKIYVLTEDVNGKISSAFTVKSFIVPQVFVSVVSPNNGDYKRTQENFIITGLWSNNIGEIKSISVKWIEGNITKEASFDSSSWNVNSSLFELTDGLQNFEITASDKFNNKGITRLYIYTDSNIPSVTNVSSSVDSGYYGPGDTIPISVQFSKRILVTGTPQIALNSGGIASYKSGSGSENLIFDYLIKNGENSLALDYNGVDSLSLNGGSIKDYYIGDEANTELIPVGEGTKGAGSILVNKYLIVDSTPPTIISVRSNPTEGCFNKDKMITIKVNFSETVIVEGTPKLKLNVLPEGKEINYQFGSYSDSLTFIYTVESGNNSADLDYFDINSLSLNGGTIRDISGNDANITLPDLGGPNSIGAVSNVTIDTIEPDVPTIVEIDKEHFSITSIESTVQYSIDNGAWMDYLGGSVKIPLKSSTSIAAKQRDLAGNWSEVAISTIAADTTLPAVVNVTSTKANGSYKSGEIIPISIQFTRDVIVTGTPQIKLETGESDRLVNYSSGSGTSLLIFDYTVQNGDFALNLDYVDTASLLLNGGTIQDDLSRDSSLVLSAPSTPRSLGFNKTIKIDTIRPTVVNVTSTSPNAIYKNGDALPILIDFSEVVDVTGIPTLSLNSGAVVSYSSGTGTTTLLFNYTVANGENAVDLDYPDKNSLSLNGGKIIDKAGNDADLILADPGTEKSLGYNKNIAVDTTKPKVLSVDSDNADMSYNAGNVISIKVELDEPVTVTGTPKLLLETGDIDRYATYSIGSGTNIIKFSYTVQAGDNVADLDYSSSLALELGAATIKDIVGNDAVITLPAPGGVGSLGNNRDIVIDTTAPSAPVIDGLNSGKLNEGTYYFNGDVAFSIAGEAGAVIEYTINGGASWSVGTSGVIVNEGSYVFQAKQRDAAGNISPISASTTIAIDKTKPNPPLISGIVSGTYNYTQSFNIAGENGAAFQYSLNNGVNWSDYDQTVDLSAAGTYNVVARQIDVAGNISLPSSAILVTIDKTNAIINSVNSTTANGSYATGKMIEIEITFSKIVYINGSPKLSLNTGAKADYYLGSGTNVLKFNYLVRSGDNTADLDYISTSALSLNGGSIKDAVGNDANLGLPAPGGVNSLGGNKNIVIDTTAPSAPAVSGISTGRFNTNKTFTYSGETDATIEYTTDAGATWIAGSGTTLSADGTYIVKGRQKDLAGNISPESGAITVTIDKSAPLSPMISGIMAGTYNTTQSFSLSGEEGATLQYSFDGTNWSVLSSGSSRELAVDGTYNVRARQIDLAGNYSTPTSVVTVIIDKTKPTVSSLSPSNAALNVSVGSNIVITFSEPVYRETGLIVIESFDVNNKFIPAILTVEEYNEICGNLSGANLTTFQESYSLGTNGAPGGTPDVVGRYILNYAIDITNAGLIAILDGINYFKVIIDVSSTQVTGSGTNVITINPFNDLAKGRKYKITIPAGSFRDSIGNTYAGNGGGWSFTTGPVATPVVRINKQSGNGDAQPTTTNFKVSCETYGASIYYTLGDNSGSVPADPNTGSTTTNPGEIGLTGNYTSNYVKHIKAIAYKSPDLTASSIAEEKAYRTVLVKNHDAGTNNIWFRGSNNGGGPTTAPGFPLRWEENQLKYIKLGKNAGSNNWYWITWEINQYVYSKPILGDKPVDWATKGPMYFGWRTGVNDEGNPGTVITGIAGTGFELWNAHTRPGPTVSTPIISTTTVDLNGNGNSQPDSITVRITCSTDGAVIRYTTNGTDPNESSTQFTADFTISSTTTVKAKAFKTDYNASSIATKVFNKTTLKVNNGYSSGNIYFRGSNNGGSDPSGGFWGGNMSWAVGVKAKLLSGTTWYATTWSFESGTITFKSLKDAAWENDPNHTVTAGGESATTFNGGY